MLRYQATTTARPEVVWTLLASPARWREWSPHARGATGLGSPEVQSGRRGTVSLFGALPVPATITDVVPETSWTWDVGPLTMVHRVTALAAGGSEITIEIVGRPRLIEPGIALTYGPVVAVVLRNLARVAARSR